MSETVLLHPVDLSLAGAGSLVPVLGGIEFVAHRQLQLARIPAAELVNVEAVVISFDIHRTPVEEIVPFQHYRQPVVEERFGDSQVDHELVIGQFHVLLVPLALKIGVEGQEESFRQRKGIVQRGGGYGAVQAYLLIVAGDGEPLFHKPDGGLRSPDAEFGRSGEVGGQAGQLVQVARREEGHGGILFHLCRPLHDHISFLFVADHELKVFPGTGERSIVDDGRLEEGVACLHGEPVGIEDAASQLPVCGTDGLCSIA